MRSIAERHSIRQAKARIRLGQEPTRRVITQTIPPPVGGWNTRDTLDIMPPEDAPKLQNWFPDFGKVVLRKGHGAAHATGIGAGDVQTIVEYTAAGTQKLLAAGGGAIYDATSAGAASSLASGFSVNRWQTAQLDSTLALVNGTDAAQKYNGSAVSALSLSGGITSANTVGVNVFQSRSYFWEENSQSVWYSAVNTMGGALTEFPLGRVGNFGGDITAMGTWAPEGGADIWGGGGLGEDLAVFFMSSGDVIIYQGSNPASWSLMGVYRAGLPVDIRAIQRIGGDLVCATSEGLISVAELVRQGRINRAGGVLTDKIQPSFIDAYSSHKDNTGWEVVFYPEGNWLHVNIPRGSDDFVQYVQNLRTGAWCEFDGIDARAWGRYNGNLYFGDGAGNIYRFWQTWQDNGTNIAADAEQAYSYFGDRGTPKRATSIRPVIRSIGSISLGIGVQTDFQTKQVGVQSITVSPSNNWEDIDVNWEDWDDDWDLGNLTTIDHWRMASGVGYALAPRLRVSADDEVEWHSTTFNLEVGQGLK